MLLCSILRRFFCARNLTDYSLCLPSICPSVHMSNDGQLAPLISNQPRARNLFNNEINYLQRRHSVHASFLFATNFYKQLGF